MSSKLAFAFLSAALLSACGSEPADNPDAAPASGSAQPGPSASPDAAGGAQQPARRIGFGPHRPGAPRDAAIGVAECDTFLTRYEACVVDQVPEEARGAMQTALESWRGSWRTLAASPTTRGNLPSMCQAAADSVRAQLTSYGCTL